MSVCQAKFTIVEKKKAWVITIALPLSQELDPREGDELVSSPSGPPDQTRQRQFCSVRSETRYVGVRCQPQLLAITAYGHGRRQMCLMDKYGFVRREVA